MGGWVGDRLGTTSSVEDMMGTTARRAAARQQAEFDAQQAQAEADKASAEEEQRRRIASGAERLAQGRASTLLTGPRGLASSAGASRTLLGR